MNSSSVKPRCWKTPASRYCANMASDCCSAEAEPTQIPSSPADTCTEPLSYTSDEQYAWLFHGNIPCRNLVFPVVAHQT